MGRKEAMAGVEVMGIRRNSWILNVPEHTGRAGLGKRQGTVRRRQRWCQAKLFSFTITKDKTDIPGLKKKAWWSKE